MIRKKGKVKHPHTRRKTEFSNSIHYSTDNNLSASIYSHEKASRMQ